VAETGRWLRSECTAPNLTQPFGSAQDRPFGGVHCEEGKQAMTQKTVGYVELEWTCPYCGTRNPGTQKKCSGCGAMMGEEDQFEAPAQQELITDEAKLAQAKRGMADIHCPYCGTRNVAGSEKCRHCGGDLTGAVEREKGRVVGAFRAEPVADVPCPYCGTPNPANTVKCKKCGGALQKPAEAPPAKPAAAPKPRSRVAGLAIAAVVVLMSICAVAYFVLGSRTTDTPAVVQSVMWERSVAIMEQRPVTHEDWEDQIPAGAVVGSCSKEFRRTQSEPAPGAEEVCGTPYTKTANTESTRTSASIRSTSGRWWMKP